jgi:hypothetical protein
VPSVQHSVKGIFAESLNLPSAALGKAFFVECPITSTRQSRRHSAKPAIPVVIAIASCGRREVVLGSYIRTYLVRMLLFVLNFLCLTVTVADWLGYVNPNI